MCKMWRKWLIMSTLLVITKASQTIDHIKVVAVSNAIEASHGSGGPPIEGTLREEMTVMSSPLDCFHFTWPGETFNESEVDCVKAVKADKHEPCILPFIITDDGTVPNPSTVMDYCNLHSCKVTCKRGKSESCVRYSLFRNQKLFKQSYFCGSGQDTTDNRPITSGEYSEKLSGEHAGDVRRVNFCADTPLCNSANRVFIPPVVLILVLVATYILQEIRV